MWLLWRLNVGDGSKSQSKRGWPRSCFKMVSCWHKISHYFMQRDIDRELEAALITQAGNNAITCKRLRGWRMMLRQRAVQVGVGARVGSKR